VFTSYNNTLEPVGQRQQKKRHQTYKLTPEVNKILSNSNQQPKRTRTPELEKEGAVKKQKTQDTEPDNRFIFCSGTKGADWTTLVVELPQSVRRNLAGINNFVNFTAANWTTSKVSQVNTTFFNLHPRFPYL